MIDARLLGFRDSRPARSRGGSDPPRAAPLPRKIPALDGPRQLHPGCYSGAEGRSGKRGPEQSRDEEKKKKIKQEVGKTEDKNFFGVIFGGNEMGGVRHDESEPLVGPPYTKTK